MLRAHSISCIKMVFTLLAEVIIFHMQVSIVEVGVSSLEKAILQSF